MNHLDRPWSQPVYGIYTNRRLDPHFPVYRTLYGAERATRGMTGDVKIVPMYPEPYEAKQVGR